jgi:hypothetical protein
MAFSGGLEESPEVGVFMATPKKRTMKMVELAPDAWRRFERAIDVVAKSPPQHRVKDTGKRKKSRKAKKKK